MAFAAILFALFFACLTFITPAANAGTSSSPTKSQADGATTTYTLNPIGESTAQSTAVSGNARTSYTGIAYDGAGNTLGMTTTLAGAPSAYSGTTSLVYDAAGLDQLADEQSSKMGGYAQRFAYDNAGNPTTFRSAAGPSYNSDDQASGSTYDGDGNPTTYRGVPLIYDTEDRLTKDTSANFTAGYEANDLRAWKTDAAGTTYYVYAGDTPIVEENAAGAVEAYNTFAGGLISRYSGGASTFYAFDPMGNVAERMNSAGAVTSEDSYDAYGEKITTNGTADPFGYHGEDGYYTDSETGLIYLEHRYYDPGTGRFLNRDPMGYAGGSDLYAYCENGPVDGSDPTGLASDLPEWILEHSQSEFDAPGEECPPADDPEYSLSGQEEMDGEVQGMGVGSADYDATFGEQVVTDGYAADCPGTPTGKHGPSGGSPALRGDPYSPEAVEARIKPPYSINYKHVPGSGMFKPGATILPDDAEEAYSTAEQSPIGTWWARGKDGWYRYFSDNAGTAHFSGTAAPDDVPAWIVRTRGR